MPSDADWELRHPRKYGCKGRAEEGALEPSAERTLHETPPPTGALEAYLRER